MARRIASGLDKICESFIFKAQAAKDACDFCWRSVVALPETGQRKPPALPGGSFITTTKEFTMTWKRIYPDPKVARREVPRG